MRRLSLDPTLRWLPPSRFIGIQRLARHLLRAKTRATRLAARAPKPVCWPGPERSRCSPASFQSRWCTPVMCLSGARGAAADSPVRRPQRPSRPLRPRPSQRPRRSSHPRPPKRSRARRSMRCPRPRRPAHRSLSSATMASQVVCPWVRRRRRRAPSARWTTPTPGGRRRVLRIAHAWPRRPPLR